MLQQLQHDIFSEIMRLPTWSCCSYPARKLNLQVEIKNSLRVHSLKIMLCFEIEIFETPLKTSFVRILLLTEPTSPPAVQLDKEFSRVKAVCLVLHKSQM